MKLINAKDLSDNQKLEVYELWNKEYPEKLNYESLIEFENYLGGLTDQSHILMLDDSNHIQGWYFDFIRESEKWFAIIINSEHHGKGLGTQILNRAKSQEHVLNGWVIDHDNYKKNNGETYKSPLAFYLKNEFQKIEDTRLELEILSAVKIQWSR